MVLSLFLPYFTYFQGPRGSTVHPTNPILQAPYDQFLLFGDSITQAAYDQSDGFCLGAALQNGMLDDTIYCIE